MKTKWIAFTIFGIYALFFITQLSQFLMLSDSFTGPYAFLMSMVVFNLMFLVLSKTKVNYLAIGVSTFYFIWYTTMFFTVREGGMMLGVDMYYFFFKHTFNPQEIHALSAHFSNAIAVSVYLLPWLFILNFDVFKQLYKNKQ